jgi:hypothetical protein
MTRPVFGLEVSHLFLVPQLKAFSIIDWQYISHASGFNWHPIESLTS